MAFARIGDVAVHHAFAPLGNRPLVVFVNSLGTDFRLWDAVMPLLGARVGHLRYDKRGHGLTDVTSGPYAIDTLAADLAGLCDHLGIDAAVICGISVGGMIAQALAAQRPELVRGLVLADTGHRIGPPERWTQRIATVRNEGIEAIADAVTGLWLTAAFRDARPAELSGWRNMLVRTPAEGYVATCAAIRDADLTAAARGIRVPTLCICGDQDGATPPELARELSELVPGSRFASIEKAGHLPCIEQPGAFARAMMGFLEETGLA